MSLSKNDWLTLINSEAGVANKAKKKKEQQKAAPTSVADFRKLDQETQKEIPNPVAPGLSPEFAKAHPVVNKALFNFRVQSDTQKPDNALYRGLEQFYSGFDDAISFGLLPRFDRWMGQAAPEPQTRAQGIIRGVGELSGSVLPVSKLYGAMGKVTGRLPEATSTMGRLAQTGLNGGLAGGAYGALEGLGSGMSPNEIARNTALNAALFAGGDVALKGAGLAYNTLSKANAMDTLKNLDLSPPLPGQRSGALIEPPRLEPIPAPKLPEIQAMVKPTGREGVNQFIDEALKNKPGSFKALSLQEVKPEEAARIKELIDLDVSGYRHEINNFDLRHAMKHGNPKIEGQRGQLPITEQDLKAIPDIINSPDEILPGSKALSGKGKDLIYTKRVNGSIYYVEVVNSKKGVLTGKTMWKKPSAAAHAVPEAPLHYTSEAEPGMTSSNSNIKPGLKDVNNPEGDLYRISRGGPAYGSSSQGTVKRSDIVKLLKEKLEVPIRTGRYPTAGGQVLGVFKTRPEVIRSRTANDLPTIAHEVGHVLDKRLGLQNPAHDAELMKLGRGSSRSSYTPEQVRAEGVAEFMRLYLTDTVQAARLTPGYYRAFEEVMAQHKDIHKVLLQAREGIETWFNQSPEARVDGVISTGEKTLRQRISGLKNAPEQAKKLYTGLVDDLDPLRRATKELNPNLPPAESPFELARTARGWVGKAETFLNYGVLDANGNKVGKGLKEILRPVEKDLQGFRRYVVAKHAQEINAQKMSTGIWEKDAKAVAAGAPFQYRQTLEDLVKYQDAVLNQLVEAGVMTPQSVKAMREKYPNYVPFYREFPENPEAALGFLTGKGYANLKNPIKRMKGSERDIIDPLESIVKNTYLFTQLAEKNKVGRQLAELAEKHEGMGWLAEKVGGNRSAKENVLTIYRNGQPEQYQLQPDLYRAMLALDTESMSTVVKLLSFPASTLRAGAVLSPDFIPRNVVRDQFSAFVNSKYGFVPVVDTLRGLFHAVKKDEVYWQWMNSGGAMSTLVSLDREYLQRNLRQLMRKSAKDIAAMPFNPKTYLDMLRTLTEYGELGTRLGEFGKGLKKGATPMEAALASREVTLDFGRMGYQMKNWNRITAFLNAQVQGMDKAIRQFKANPTGSTIKSLVSITLPSVVLYEKNKDDPRYQELPQWQKDLFWIVLTDDHVLRIPKPFELGVLFGTLPERILAQMDGKEDAFKGFGETLKDLLPDVRPTALTPAYEVASNYSMFTDRPIVPQREQNLEPWQQYGPYTTEMAKAVGKAANASPRKVEHLIQGYGGGLGRYATQLASMGMEGDGIPRAKKDITEYPGIKAFTVTPYASSQSIDDFYDRLGELERSYSTARQAGKAKTPPAELSRMRRFSEQLSELRKKEREIQNNRTMTPERKRAALDALDKQSVNVARKALQREGI